MHHIGIDYLIVEDSINHLLWTTPCNEFSYTVKDYNAFNYNTAVGKNIFINPTEKVLFGRGKKPDVLIPKWYPFLRSVDCPECDAYLQMKLLSETDL